VGEAQVEIRIGCDGVLSRKICWLELNRANFGPAEGAQENAGDE
jgi:hypothetical protein